MPFVLPDYKVVEYDFFTADLEILTRLLHEIAAQMLSRDAAGLFRALHEMECYCQRSKAEIYKEPEA